jgi:chromosome segregation protein
VKRAEGRKEFELELTAVQDKYFGSLLAEYKMAMAETDTKKSELNKKIVQIDEKIAKLQEKISSERENPHTTERRDLEAKVVLCTEERDKLMREVSYLRGQVESLSRNANLLVNKKTELEAEQKSLTDKVHFLSEKITEEKKLLSELSRKLDESKVEIEKSNMAQLELDAQLASSGESKDSSRASELEAELNVLSDKKQEIAGKLYSLRQEVNYAKLRAEQNEQKALGEAKQLDGLYDRVAAEEALEKARLDEVQAITVEIKNKKNLFDGVVRQIESLEESLHDLAAQIDPTSLGKLEIDITEIDKAKKAIAAKFLNVENNKDYSSLKLGLEGFFGRVDKLLEQLRKVSKAVNSSEREKLESKLTGLRTDSTGLGAEISSLELRLARLESEAEAARSRIKDLKSRIEEKEHSISELKIAKEQLPDPELVQSLNTQLEKVNADIVKVETDYKKYLGTVSERQNAILKQKNALQGKTAEFHAKLHENELSYAKQNTVIENQETEIRSAERRLAEIGLTLEQIQIQNSGIGDSELNEKLATKEKLLNKSEEDLAKYRGGLTQAISAEREFEQQGLVFEREKRISLDGKNDILRQFTSLDVETAKTQVRLENLQEEIRLSGITLSDANYGYLDQMEKDVLKIKMENLKRKLETTTGVDPETEAEYAELESRTTEMTAQVTDLTKAKEDLTKVIGELDERIKHQFADVFKSISSEFSRYFAMLFNGGHSELKLGEDEEGNFGIEITANPPGKKVQSLNSLSGGERTLTSLALLFAILSVNPSPFCVLDEVDAALDESNTLRFVKILADLAGKTQFIVISHNRDTMKIAGSLYGVTMNDEHISKLLSVKLTDALVSAK